MAKATSTLRALWADYRCVYQDRDRRSRLVDDTFRMWGRYVGGVPKVAVDAYRAAEQALVVSGYPLPDSIWVRRDCPTGIAGATCQPTGTGCSLHNYLCAFDLDPLLNRQSPGGRFAGRIQADQVAAVEAIRNIDGDQVWAWGGWWALPDRMHFQLNVAPDRLVVDWSTVLGGNVTAPANRNEFVAQHADPFGVPDWSPWQEYVDAGGSSLPQSGVWSAQRYDLAWYWDRFVRPLQAAVADLGRRVAALEAAGGGGGGTGPHSHKATVTLS